MAWSATSRCSPLLMALACTYACATYDSLERAAQQAEAGESAGGNATPTAGASSAGSGAGGAAAGRGGSTLGGSSTVEGGTSSAAGTEATDAGESAGGTGSSALKPTGLRPSATTSSLVRETDANGTLYEERCPDGQVLIGFNGTMDEAGAPDSKSYLRSAEGLCGEISVSQGEPYTVLVTPGATLPLHDVAAPQTQTALCPANQVVTGFAGRSGLWMDSVDVRCAPLTILGQSPTFLLVVGTPSKAGTIGGNSGGSPFDPLECDAGAVAVGQILRTIYSGDVFGTFGVQCAVLTLELEPG